MARKATDLLDVFRFSGEGTDEGSEGASPARRKKRAPARKAAARSKRPRKRFEGIALNRQQLLLASSAIGLLLVLSFVLGLATGRPDGNGDAQALNRQVAQRVLIRARLPVVDPATRKAANVGRLARDLCRDYRINPRNLRIRHAGARLVIDIGPFPSREEARSWLERSGLELEHIHMEDPFRFPEFVAVPGGATPP